MQPFSLLSCRPFGAIALVVALGACGGAAPIQESPADTALPEGTRSIHNEVGVWGPGDGWRIEAEPDLTLGLVAGDPVYQFTDIGAAATRSDGSIVVVDRGIASVRLFDRDGAFLTTLGGAGQGPGEFAYPTDVRVEVDDRVVVWDQRLWRRTTFSTDGASFEVDPPFLEELVAASAPPVYPESARIGPGGSLLITMGEKPQEEPTLGWSRSRGGLMTRSVDGAIEHRLELAGPQLVGFETPWGVLSDIGPLAQRPVMAAQPSGERICATDQSGAWVICLDGPEPPVRISWPTLDRPLDSADPDLAAWRQATIDAYGLKTGRREAESMVQAIPLPERQPELRAIALDPDGFLWVDTGRSPEGRELRVFEPSGTLLGTVVTPELRLLEVGRSHLLGVTRDDLGVQRVVRFRLDKGGAS